MADDVLQFCRACGRSGALSISERAHAGARDRGQSRADLVHALAHARACEPGEDRWVVRGPSLDGTELTLDVVLGADKVSIL